MYSLFQELMDSSVRSVGMKNGSCNDESDERVRGVTILRENPCKGSLILPHFHKEASTEVRRFLCVI